MSIDIKKFFRVCNPRYTLDYAKSEDRLWASGEDDAAIKLWKVENGLEINSPRSHSGIVYSVAFSPDGRLLASASGDSSIKVWRLEAFIKDDLDQLLTDGCRRLQGYLRNTPRVNEPDRHLCDQRLTPELPHYLSH